MEDHTRNVLSTKTKDTQLTRARADADTAKSQLVRLQREVDNLRQQGNVSDMSRAQEDGATAVAHETSFRKPESRVRPGFFAPTLDDEKENGFEGVALKDIENGDPEAKVEGWRRAADVTNQLKARIEQMKLRNSQITQNKI